MKILVSVQQDVFGGPQNQWLRIHPLLADEGVEVVFLLPGERPDAGDRLRSAGCEVEYLPTPRLTLRGGATGAAALLPEVYRAGGRVAEVARHLGADVVVSAGLANLPAAIGAKRAGLPLVWQLLSVFAPAYVRTGLGFAVATLSDAVMAVGSRCRRAHPPLRLSPSKVVEFFPPVDLTEFAPDPDRNEAPEGTPPLIGTVGNLNPHKGHDILWEACSRLWGEGHDFRVRVCGHPSPSYQEKYDAALEAWTASLEPEWRPRVEYIHPEGPVAPYLKDLDIFVLPSRSEGVPTVLLEAMGVGLPVVAFDIGGVGEVVEDGKDGLIAGAPSADNLLAPLARVLGDENARVAMGTAARRAAEAKFSAERCAEQHLRAIRIALGQGH